MAIQFDAKQYFPASAKPNPVPTVVSGGQQVDRRPRSGTDPFVRFQSRLQELQRNSTSAPQILKGVAGLLSSELAATGVWLAIESNEPQQPGQLKFLPLFDREDDPLWPLVGPAIEECAGRAMKSGNTVVHELSQSIRLVVMQMNRPGQPGEALAVCFPTPVSKQASSCTALAAAAVTQWRTDRLIEISGEHAQTAHRMLGLCKSVASASSIDDACIAIVNQLAAITGATQVCILTATSTSRPTVRAVSGVESFDKTSNVIGAAINSASTPGELGRCQFWQEGENELDGLSNVSAYAKEVSARAAGSITIELTEDTTATFLFAFANVHTDSEPYRKRIEQLAIIAAGQLSQCIRLHASPTQRLVLRWKAKLQEKLVRNLMIGAAALTLLLLCPVPYRVSCETRLEPVSRRFVAAPYDATLERTLAKNGDSVRAGDIVAILDGRDLRMEYSALQAELAAAKKRHDSSLATGDIAGAQVARSEAKRAEAELGLVEQHLGQLEVRSPIDGVIVSGDLDTAQGISLKTGQTLFEIGPLDRVRAEVLIPDSELRHVKPDAKATVWLAAWPFQSWTGTIIKVHQRSEIVNEQNCFVAEVEIDNPDGRLRPGMQGQGRIQSGWRTLGWVWTHRAWERMRYLLVW